MKTIETIAAVTSDGKLVATVPTDIAPGEYSVVLLLEETTEPSERDTERSVLPIQTVALKGWPLDCTFRREDIYGAEGR
ncbi:MAG TPA: hypothetical protein PLG59_07630 [bacterium]|nr:hypothetical protein [bacterium]HQO34515.1 hypothetical protein [bacterium]HQP99224.1 hypothetical protein [bacterium]